MDHLKNEIKIAKTLNLHGYKFRVFSFGERGQLLSYELINEITRKLSKSIKKNFKDFDYIISPEPGGHLWGALVALKMKKDLHILRLRQSKQEGEIKVDRRTAYGRNQLFFNKFSKGDRVVLLDDVVSSGYTLKALLGTLKKKGVKVVGAQTILARTKVYEELEKKYKVKIKFLEKEF